MLLVYMISLLNIWCWKTNWCTLPLESQLSCSQLLRAGSPVTLTKGSVLVCFPGDVHSYGKWWGHLSREPGPATSCNFCNSNKSQQTALAQMMPSKWPRKDQNPGLTLEYSPLPCWPFFGSLHRASSSRRQGGWDPDDLPVPYSTFPPSHHPSMACLFLWSIYLQSRSQTDI